jgi:hypothetical protein
VKHIPDTPLILVGKMWPGLVDWARKSLLATEPPLISPGDLDIPTCVDTAEDAVALLRDHHAKWKRQLAN